MLQENPDGPPSGDGIRGVSEKVEEGLLHLVGIHKHREGALLPLLFDADAFGPHLFHDQEDDLCHNILE